MLRLGWATHIVTVGHPVRGEAQRVDTFSYGVFNAGLFCELLGCATTDTAR